MKLTTSLFLSGLVAPAVLGLGLPAAEITFAPAEAARLTKTFQSNGQFTLDDMTVLVNGSDPGQMPEMDMQMRVTQTVVLTDDYGAVTDGAPQKLTRHFDEITQEIDVEVTVDMMGSTQNQSQAGSGTSELEGTTVVFTRGEDGEYTTAFVDGEGDSELLEGLVEDTDLRAFLPDGEVAEGDEWEIPLVSMVDILAPGGDLHIEVEMEGEEVSMGGPDPASMTDFRQMLGDLLEGEATARYAGTREVDGTEVDVIEIDLDLESARDMSEFIDEYMDDAETPEGMEMSIDRVDVEFTLDAEGELLWNAETNLPLSFSLSGDATITMDMAMNMDMNGQSMVMEMTMEMSGTLSQSLSTQ